MPIQLPPSPRHPVFGSWVDLPRKQWTVKQAAHYDRQMHLYRKAVDAFNAVQPIFVAEIHKEAARLPGAV